VVWSRPKGCPARRRSPARAGRTGTYGSPATSCSPSRGCPPSSSSSSSSSGHYDRDALLIATTVGELARFGIEARHLRAFKTAADREIGLVEQVVAPLVRQRNPEAKARADEVARELAALSVRLHATLVKAGLRPGLSR
jgi:hypothetical protein